MNERNSTSEETNDLIQSILSDYEEHEQSQTSVARWGDGGCPGMCCVESR